MNDLQKIPGIGKNMEKHLNNLGFYTIESLKNADPEQMYELDKQLNGGKLDRCVLYVYRLAVYYSENDEHDAEKLKWWNWKD